ncbi:MAG: hypothetical protein ACTSUR_04400 [Candidatus Heimdallarchaeaceae archaeon]
MTGDSEEDIEKRIDSLTHKHNQKKISSVFGSGLLLFFITNLLWLLFRTGTKPSRIIYPCQRAAVKNLSFSFSTFLPIITFSFLWGKMKTFLLQMKFILLSILLISPIIGAVYLESANVSNKIDLIVESKFSSSEAISDIFVVNGLEIAHIEDLIDLMGDNNLFFYQTSSSGVNQTPNGLISNKDVVLIKNNC